MLDAEKSVSCEVNRNRDGERFDCESWGWIRWRERRVNRELFSPGGGDMIGLSVMTSCVLLYNIAIPAGRRMSSIKFTMMARKLWKKAWANTNNVKVAV